MTLLDRKCQFLYKKKVERKLLYEVSPYAVFFFTSFGWFFLQGSLTIHHIDLQFLQVFQVWVRVSATRNSDRSFQLYRSILRLVVGLILFPCGSF